MADDIALLQATSDGIAADGTTRIVLRWETVGEAVGYRLRRRTPGGPSIVLGGADPIRLPQSARELRTVVSPGTEEWNTLARVLTAAQSPPPADPTVLVDPAAVFDRGLTAFERASLQAASQADLTIGRVDGLAFIDTGVTAGEAYLYDLLAERAHGGDLVLAADVPVTAGVFTLPAPPSGLTAQSGDRRVLVLWNRNPLAATYLVQRAPARAVRSCRSTRSRSRTTSTRASTGHPSRSRSPDSSTWVRGPPTARRPRARLQGARSTDPTPASPTGIASCRATRWADSGSGPIRSRRPRREAFRRARRRRSR